jgi:uncharacterized membrane protein
MLQLFLFLHVMGAIVTFGPSFVFPLIANRARSAPQHAHFAAETTHLISTRVAFPGAILQGLTGVALILITGANLTSPAYRWLVAAIVLYLIAIGYSALVQTPAATKMVELTAGPPPGAGAPGGAPGAPGGAPAGPPPEVVATGRKLARGGMLLSGLVVVIVILMVTKPVF